MVRSLRFVIVGIAICALFGASAGSTLAGTIIKLSLGGDPAPDIEFTGGAGGKLSTADDAIVSAGDQNTAVEFLDFLDPVATDIATPTASFTLDGLTAAGPATVFSGALVLQNFAGGTLELYDPADTLLLSGALATSALTGTLGPPGTGGLFTTTFSVVTGGTLAPYIDTTSLTVSMNLGDINGGAGLSVTPLPAVPPPVISMGFLDAFTADASINIAGEAIPEPTSVALWLLGCALSVATVRRKKRR